MFFGGSAKGLEPGILLGDGGHRLVGELLSELEVDSTSGLKFKMKMNWLSA
jgi:hypothetical protein